MPRVYRPYEPPPADDYYYCRYERPRPAIVPDNPPYDDGWDDNGSD